MECLVKVGRTPKLSPNEMLGHPKTQFCAQYTVNKKIRKLTSIPKISESCHRQPINVFFGLLCYEKMRKFVSIPNEISEYCDFGWILVSDPPCLDTPQT